MSVVVITGSTRGIGKGLAEAFLDNGCSVVISSRSADRVHAIVNQLSQKFDDAHMFGCACDVTDIDQIRTLWDEAHKRFGKIDYWINNAGVNSRKADFWEQNESDIRTTVNTNLIGTMNGCFVAIDQMMNQGFGAVYNMEGLGSQGPQVPGVTLYGATKCAVTYFTRGLAKELKKQPVSVGMLSPGMVVTDLLIGEYDTKSDEWKRTKRVLNILADRVETVTPWLAKHVLENKKNGKRLAWLTTTKIMYRFMTGPFRRRDLFT